MKPLPETDAAQRRSDIEKTLTERIKWFDLHYDILSHHAMGPETERIYLGDKAKRVCRYCGSAAPEVKSRKLAHAIPDQVGNDWLFDHEECDACNEHFAKRVEDDFSKWTLPWRSTGRTKGKKGFPSLKSADKKFRIDVANEKLLKIYMGVNDTRHSLDEATNSVKLTLERQPYVPMGVFKCLVKMAIAVMPTVEAQRCAHLKKWILLPNHTFESYRYTPLGIIYQFVPGPLPNDELSYWLIRRKPERADDCLYMQFVLQLANHIFQISLPMHVEDRKQLEVGTFQTSLWPSTWAGIDHQLQYGRPDHKHYDMSPTEKIRDETTTLTLKYRAIEHIDTSRTSMSSTDLSLISRIVEDRLTGNRN